MFEREAKAGPHPKHDAWKSQLHGRLALQIGQCYWQREFFLPTLDFNSFLIGLKLPEECSSYAIIVGYRSVLAAHCNSYGVPILPPDPNSFRVFVPARQDCGIELLLPDQVVETTTLVTYWEKA